MKGMKANAASIWIKNRGGPEVIDIYKHRQQHQ